MTVHFNGSNGAAYIRPLSVRYISNPLGLTSSILQYCRSLFLPSTFLPGHFPSLSRSSLQPCLHLSLPYLGLPPISPRFPHPFLISVILLFSIPTLSTSFPVSSFSSAFSSHISVSPQYSLHSVFFICKPHITDFGHFHHISFHFLLLIVAFLITFLRFSSHFSIFSSKIKVSKLVLLKNINVNTLHEESCLQT
jgi:hypothetical protein